MILIENKTNYDFNKIILTAKRENNNKRKFLLVNMYQAKHIPVSPDLAYNMFYKLGEEIYNKYKNENVLVIGFAETATAIGAVIAKVFGKKTYYIHTTREEFKNIKNIADFNEEHSHATEQKLFCDIWYDIIKDIDRIIFAEDEITTGKTILNFVDNLIKSNSLKSNIKFTAASIVNGMSKENECIFENKNVNFDYLIKINNNNIENKIGNIEIDKSLDFDCTDVIEKKDIEVIEIRGKQQPRTGILSSEYEIKTNDMINSIFEYINKETLKNKKVLVIGTEEFMYPVIKTANKILSQCSPLSVSTHSTTRSPIIPFKKEGYPIYKRYKILSLYDSKRITYIYNLDCYDKVIVITDSEEKFNLGIYSLYKALKLNNCNDISFFRWVN